MYLAEYYIKSTKSIAHDYVEADTLVEASTKADSRSNEDKILVNVELLADYRTLGNLA